MKKLIALALVSSFALAACGSNSSTTEETVVDITMAEEIKMDDIVAVASATEGFTTLIAAVAAAGLVETLQGEGPFTVFAPTPPCIIGSQLSLVCRHGSYRFKTND